MKKNRELEGKEDRKKGKGTIPRNWYKRNEKKYQVRERKEKILYTKVPQNGDTKSKKKYKKKGKEKIK
jgi:hypothetical protein